MPRCNKPKNYQNGDPKGQGVKSMDTPDGEHTHPIHDEKEQGDEDDFVQERHVAMMALNIQDSKSAALDNEIARQGAILMRDLYGQLKGVHAWASYFSGPSRTFQPGDFLAVNVTAPIWPRQVVGWKLKTVSAESRGTIAVYLGMQSDAVALCDPQAFEPTLDRINTWTIPLADLSHIVEIVGVASPARAYRKLSRHKFKGWERRAVERWERYLLAIPLPAMRGDYLMEFLPAMASSNGSIH
jgi:hypothetical protein